MVFVKIILLQEKYFRTSVPHQFHKTKIITLMWTDKQKLNNWSFWFAQLTINPTSIIYLRSLAPGFATEGVNFPTFSVVCIFSWSFVCKIFSLSLSLSPPSPTPPLPAVSSHFENPVFAEITFKLFAASVLVLMLADVDVARCFGRFFQPYRPDFSFKFKMLEILKLEYFSNHWSDIPHILNLSLPNQTKLKFNID